ncbi:hypothetical protein I308_100034 [Cryptococcus tetragattii IND107]|uniref:Uncharacterized protein n=1 Tax=Cryptococcus tetragattii IND107 TaxID=1296105 RepID=A0ABR3C3M7_9TREE
MAVAMLLLNVPSKRQTLFRIDPNDATRFEPGMALMINRRHQSPTSKPNKAYSNTAYPTYDTTGLACRRRLKIEKEIFSIRFWYRDQFHLNIAITTSTARILFIHRHFACFPSSTFNLPLTIHINISIFTPLSANLISKASCIAVRTIYLNL